MKYLGIHIDDSLKLDVNLDAKRAKESTLLRKKWLFNKKGVSGPQRYHIWQTLWKANYWYELVLAGMFSQKILEWTKSTIYRGIKILLNLKGNPNAKKLLLSTTGYSPDNFMEHEWRKQVWKLLEQYYITNLDQAKKIFDQFPVDITWNLTQHSKDYEAYNRSYYRLKLCAQHEAKNWIKW